MLLLWLSSWSENVGGEDVQRAWKGYDFQVLDRLAEEGFIVSSRKAKSVYLTEAGVAAAKALASRLLQSA